MKKKIIIPWLVILLLSVNVKAQWSDISAPTNQILTHAAFTDDLRGYVGSQNYVALWRTLDGGNSWDSTVFAESFVDVDFSSDMNGAVLLHGNPNHLIKTTNDGGINWTTINFPNGPFESFSGIITKDINTYFVMSYNYLLKTNDAGVNWDTISFVGYPYSNDKEKINSDTLFFTGWDGTFMYQGSVTKSYDGGNSWSFIPTNDNYTNFNGTHFSTGMNGYGIYSSGWDPDTSYLTKTIDGGVSWNVIHYDTSVTYNDVFMKNQLEGSIALTEGNQGKIKTTIDGINWNDELITNFGLQRLFHAENTLYVIGVNGQVFKKNVPLGILDNEISNIEIYPNPAQNYLQIQNSEIMNLTMSDINGKIVLSKKIQPNERIQLGDFANGMYFLRIENKNEIQQGKLVIEK